MSLRLGIDTGGTYTDAVLLDDATQRVVAKSKALTTRHDLVEGISAAIASVMENAVATDVSLVCLSTTLATNSIVEGHGARAGLILIGYRQSQMALAHLNEAARDLPVVFLAGGHDAAGHEREPLNLATVSEHLKQLDGSVSSIAISAMFSVRNPSHELAVRELVHQHTSLPVTCGHELSASLDAPRRALTALINARLIPLVKSLISSTQTTLDRCGIEAPLMVVRGDGTLVSAEFAEDSPVETILSGPAASVVGAQFLARRNDMLIADIGGTTTDVAMIRDGAPRLSREGASVNGWRTMVEAVQIDTHGLGGDSEIVFDREQRHFTIGPGKVTPLCVLAVNYPRVLEDLEAFVDEPWTKTNMARFIVLRKAPAPATRLTSQQRGLIDQVSEHPQSMQSVFAERHFSLALKRLIETGVLTIAGFTPTDAAHVCGWYRQWNSRAAVLGATLLGRYSEFNLGPAWENPESFATSMLLQVSQDSAFYLLASAINDQRGDFGVPLQHSERKLLQQMFKNHHDQPGEMSQSLLGMQAQLNLPVIGIGAPAAVFYPPIDKYLQAEIIVPEHAEVANAIGAVVGAVKQTAQLTISPVSAKRVVVHAPTEQREFDDLEQAAEWATEVARDLAKRRAEKAGGKHLQLSVSRRDNVVEQQGQSTFFESTITVTATGRAG